MLETKLFIHSLTLLSLKVLALVLTLVFNYLLAKNLSAEEYGLFSLAMSFLLLATVLSKQGLEPVIVRFCAKAKQESVTNLYFFVISYASISALIIGIVIYFLATPIASVIFDKPMLAVLLPTIAMLTVIQTWIAINSSALKGRGHAGSSLLFSGVMTFVFALILVWQRPPDSAFLAINQFTMAAALACVVSFIITGFQLKLSVPTKRFESKKLLSASGDVFIISIAAYITQQMAQLVLGRYASLEEVGLFSIAIKVTVLVSIMLVVVNTITAPKYAKLHEDGNKEAFKTLAYLANKILFVWGTLSVVFIYIFANEIAVIFGEQYLEAGTIIRILLIGQWFNLATGSVVSMLIMTGHEKLHRRNTLILTAINILALFIFIPLFGIIAAAWITTFIMATRNLQSLYFVNKLIYRA